jgi:hypothetical protein
MSRKIKTLRFVTISLGALLAVSVLLNLSGMFQVPRRITLFMTGALISIGVGRSILSPNTSLSRLNPREEDSFRRRQFVVGLVLSVLLGLTLIVEDVRKSPLAWLFLPIIALPGFLWILERTRRTRR